ncbi:MAG: hypothetical protein ACI308_07550 [Muribaculaceae bacterium]
MKKILVLALVALMGVGTMCAQRGEGRKKMTVEQTVASMTKELNLTADQQKKITAIYTDFENKRKENSGLTREQMQTEREKVNKKVSDVLNDEQKKKFENMKQSHRGGGKRQK